MCGAVVDETAYFAGIEFGAVGEPELELVLMDGMKAAMGAFMEMAQEKEEATLKGLEEKGE